MQKEDTDKQNRAAAFDTRLLLLLWFQCYVADCSSVDMCFPSTSTWPKPLALTLTNKGGATR